MASTARTCLSIVTESQKSHVDSRRTVLAGASRSSATFPGPLISGRKVGAKALLQISYGLNIIYIIQGDTFSLNVINQLTDTSMLTSTSIVCDPISRIGITTLTLLGLVV